MDGSCVKQAMKEDRGGVRPCEKRGGVEGISYLREGVGGAR